MKELRFTGDFEDLKRLRFTKGNFTVWEGPCYGKPTNGVIILIYDDRRIRIECNGLNAPAVEFLKPLLDKMKIPYEETGEEDSSRDE